MREVVREISHYFGSGGGKTKAARQSTSRPTDDLIEAEEHRVGSRVGGMAVVVVGDVN